MLDNISNQLSKFKRNNWVEIDDDKDGTYDKKNLKFKSQHLLTVKAQ